MNQEATNQNSGQGKGDPAPAQSTAFTELQAMSGALSPGVAPSGTPQAGTNAPASGSSQGGGTPASSAAAGGQVSELGQVMAYMEKISSRVDNQGRYLQQLTTKMDKSTGDIKSDMESRFSQQAATFQNTGEGGKEGDPPTQPPFDAKQFASSITRSVRDSISKEFAPLVQQTAQNTVTQRILASQADPEVKQMVDELPPEVRFDLAAQVHAVAGDKLFAAPSELYEEPDHVKDAIEMIHYKTVIKPGRRTGGQAVSGETQAGNVAPQQGVPFSPVPGTGTVSQEAGQDAQAREASELFGTPVGKAKYPAGVARDLGIE